MVLDDNYLPANLWASDLNFMRMKCAAWRPSMKGLNSPAGITASGFWIVADAAAKFTPLVKLDPREPRYGVSSDRLKP